MIKNHCLTCGRMLDANTHAGEGEATPQPGDFSLCLYCGAIGMFNKEMNLKPVNETDLYNLYIENEDTYRLLLKARQIIKDQKKAKA